METDGRVVGEMVAADARGIVCGVGETDNVLTASGVGGGVGDNRIGGVGVGGTGEGSGEEGGLWGTPKVDLPGFFDGDGVLGGVEGGVGVCYV